MIVSIIVAMDEKGGIGIENRLPWHLSSDLKRFKQITMGHHLIMGRRTYESIGRTLPGRVMLVLTRKPYFHTEGAYVFSTLDDALAFAEEKGDSEVFVIGGGEVYAQSLPKVARIYLTRVHVSEDVDTFFPPFKESEWVEMHSEEHAAGDGDQYAYTYKILDRVFIPS